MLRLRSKIIRETEQGRSEGVFLRPEGFRSGKNGSLQTSRFALDQRTLLEGLLRTPAHMHRSARVLGAGIGRIARSTAIKFGRVLGGAPKWPTSVYELAIEVKL